VAQVHEIVGTLVVLAFLALTAVYVMQLRGKEIAWSRQLSSVAGGLLLLQIALGFGLLGGDNDVSPFHYLIALCTVATVGLEHGKALAEPDHSQRYRIASVAAAGTTLLALIAYAIGQSTA
jgi:heme A synthase